jgi:hypothetical protein
MTEMDGRHAAEIAIIRAQRDALASVVAIVWEVDPYGIEEWMLSAGLAERRGGTEVLVLSAFGRAALVAARR